MAKWSFATSILLLTIGAVVYFFIFRSPGKKVELPVAPSVTEALSVSKTAEIFTFEGAIPKSWETEKIREVDAVNIYDPKYEGEPNLEKSQIFIRYFQADTFLTLSTVNILERNSHQIGRRDAVTYLIEKKKGIVDFPYQPAWRNQKHFVTDIKGDAGFFYVFAKRPDLPNEIFENFLRSLSFVQNQKISSPITNFSSRVTKKGFGVFVTPENSLIKPELFQGYHTGADAEVSAEEENADVPVFAIADGEVVSSQVTPGYGGVVVIQHNIDNRQLLAIYGHLDPKNLVFQGKKIAKGERIGILGRGNSKETDFERKHLHFGLYTGSKVDLRGYVENKGELEFWLDPVKFLNLTK